MTELDLAVLAAMAALAIGAHSRRAALRSYRSRTRPGLLIPSVEETAASVERFQAAVRRFERLERIHDWRNIFLFPPRRRS